MFFFLVWGSKAKEVEVTQGRFFCPECGEERPHIHKRIDKYFTLYWIPLFRTETLTEFIECAHCQKQFKMGVLEYRPPSKQELFLRAVYGDLAGGTPLQMVYQKLLNSQIAPDVATQVISAVCGENIRSCPSCTMSFLADIAACSVCGTSLAGVPLIVANQGNVSGLLPPVEPASPPSPPKGLTLEL